MNRTKFAVLGAMLLALAFGNASARATIISFQANLDALQVVPPNASPAFGTLDATLDDSNGGFTVTSGSYQDLLGNSTSVSLNDAPVGSNGITLITLTLDTPGATSGTISGNGNLTNPQIADLVAGKGYIVVRSTVFPSGEIRGQLIAVPEPSSIALLAAGVFGLVTLGRRRRAV